MRNEGESPYISFQRPIENDEQHSQRMRESIAKRARAPGSEIATCHSRGKTAVYVSDDGKAIVEQPPHGAAKRMGLAEFRRHAG